MCCFSRPVRYVAGTKIFARGESDGRQVLAYSMSVELDEDLAMVLPIPVPPGPPEDAVRFVDLQDYDGFFTDLARAFPETMLVQERSSGPLTRGAPPPPKLVVHDVGAFEASFVPTQSDFGRLDERFRLSPDVWRALPTYADWGFAVFRLKPKKKLFGGTKKQTIHPMAFSFPRREPDAIFFPTVHVHDGAVAARAGFDHALYTQVEGVLEATLDWTASARPLGANVDAARSKGLVDGARAGFHCDLMDSLPNRDIWLRPPRGVSVADLRGAGETFSYTVKATTAYHLDAKDRWRRWQDTARTKLALLCKGLREGLLALEADRRAAWHLTTLEPTLPPYFMNGSQLWSGTTYIDGKREESPSGPGRLRLTPFTDDVEQQEITLAFSVMPDQSGVDAILAELRRLLDRAIAS